MTRVLRTPLPVVAGALRGPPRLAARGGAPLLRDGRRRGPGIVAARRGGRRWQCAWCGYGGRVSGGRAVGEGDAGGCVCGRGGPIPAERCESMSRLCEGPEDVDGMHL
eukprot:6668138-Prymnesium_polylepis.1